jgi:hypothetical protein
MRFTPSPQVAGIMVGDGHGHRFGKFYFSLPDEPVKELRDVQDLEVEIEFGRIKALEGVVPV